MTRLALLIAIAGAAGCAATVRSEPAYTTERTVVREQPRRVAPRWVTIADRYSADHGRQFISVAGGEFRRIRLEAVRGAPVIQKVAIEYVNDPNVQVVEINGRLPRGDGETINLNGGRRQIQRIVVYSEPGYGGMYSIYGA